MSSCNVHNAISRAALELRSVRYRLCVRICPTRLVGQMLRRGYPRPVVLKPQAGAASFELVFHPLVSIAASGFPFGATLEGIAL